MPAGVHVIYTRFLIATGATVDAVESTVMTSTTQLQCDIASSGAVLQSLERLEL